MPVSSATRTRSSLRPARGCLSGGLGEGGRGSGSEQRARANRCIMAPIIAGRTLTARCRSFSPLFNALIGRAA